MEYMKRDRYSTAELGQSEWEAIYAQGSRYKTRNRPPCSTMLAKYTLGKRRTESVGILMTKQD